jgi:hypothetical protein
MKHKSKASGGLWPLSATIFILLILVLCWWSFSQSEKDKDCLDRELAAHWPVVDCFRGDR